MVSSKRYVVVRLPYSFGYEVRPAVKRLDGKVAVPLPYRSNDVECIYRKEKAALRCAERMTTQAREERDEKVKEMW